MDMIKICNDLRHSAQLNLVAPFLRFLAIWEEEPASSMGYDLGRDEEDEGIDDR
jgi:hypothetical protein